MYNKKVISEELSKLIGWKNHYDSAEVDVLTPENEESLTDKFYNLTHPALRLDILNSTIPENRDLNEYINEVQKQGVLNAIDEFRKVMQEGKLTKELLAHGVYLEGYGWVKDTIINEGRFVGFKINCMNSLGVKASIKKIGFQFTDLQDLKIYVYHSSKLKPVKVFNLVTTEKFEWSWLEEEIELNSQDKEFTNGFFVIGYYQDDVVGSAINFKDFDFQKGPCGTCDGGVKRARWNTYNKYVSIMPFYVPSSSLDLVDRNVFDMNDAFISKKVSYGMNIKLSVECDMTEFILEHKMIFTKLVEISTKILFLRNILYSQQVNFIEEDIKNLIVRELEGDKKTNAVNLNEELRIECDNLVKTMEGISVPCLPKKRKGKLTYGVA